MIPGRYNNRKIKARSSILLGPVTGTIPFDLTFGSFIFLELVSHSVNRFLWWKCLDCLNSNRCFFGVQSVDTVGRCTTSSYLLAGPACLWRLVFRNACPEKLSDVRCPPTTLQKSYKVFQDIMPAMHFAWKKIFPMIPTPNCVCNMRIFNFLFNNFSSSDLCSEMLSEWGVPKICAHPRRSGVYLGRPPLWGHYQHFMLSFWMHSIGICGLRVYGPFGLEAQLWTFYFIY
jgi:hypothetical protein